jgi:glucose-1-phosphate adenylyltransferase
MIGHNREQDAKRFYVTEQGVVLITPDMLGQKLHDAS